MAWIFPFQNKSVSISPDSESFKTIDLSVECIVPIEDHLGSFGRQRKFHRHEGVDLYCEPGQLVVAVEDGEIVNIVNFTGPAAGSDWWHDTKAILVEGPSGVICYGEIIPNPKIRIGSRVNAGDEIGTVTPVLKVNKGRPMTMLHLELYRHGIREPIEWGPDKFDTVPDPLMDPTPLLIESIKSS